MGLPRRQNLSELRAPFAIFILLTHSMTSFSNSVENEMMTSLEARSRIGGPTLSTRDTARRGTGPPGGLPSYQNGQETPTGTEESPADR